MRMILEYLGTMMVLFVVWYLASCTRRLLKRLEEPEPKAKREFIIVKAGFEEPPAQPEGDLPDCANPLLT